MPLTGLWRHPDFARLWAGQTISQLGSQVTALALPLTAAVTLQASPGQMGLLGAAEFAPFLLFGLLAGVWVDRLPRRRVLILADVGRALLLGLIPLGWGAGLLRMELLYAVGFAVGTLTVFFDVAYQSYLPALVDRDRLIEGNARLEVSRSVAQVAGPGIAGGLVQLVSAPTVIALDAVSFGLSALCLSRIRRAEPPIVSTGDRRVWRDIGEGLRAVFGSRLLLPIAACTSTSNLFSNMAMAVYVLYVTRDLAIEPALLGTIFAIGSVGAIVGALGAGRLAGWLGLGPTLIGTAMLFPVSGLTVVAAAGPPPLIAAVLIGGQLVMNFVGPVYNVNQVSLRQGIVPGHLQGRMNASMRFLVWGTIPVGSLIGGLLGETIGLRATLLVSALGSGLAFVPLVLSPVRSLRDQPTPV